MQDIFSQHECYCVLNNKQKRNTPTIIPRKNTQEDERFQTYIAYFTGTVSKA